MVASAPHDQIAGIAPKCRGQPLEVAEADRLCFPGLEAGYDALVHTRPTRQFGLGPAVDIPQFLETQRDS